MLRIAKLVHLMRPQKKRGKPAARPISPGHTLLFLPASPGTPPGDEKKMTVFAPPSKPGFTAPLTMSDFGCSIAQEFEKSK